MRRTLIALACCVAITVLPARVIAEPLTLLVTVVAATGTTAYVIGAATAVGAIGYLVYDEFRSGAKSTWRNLKSYTEGHGIPSSSSLERQRQERLHEYNQHVQYTGEYLQAASAHLEEIQNTFPADQMALPGMRVTGAVGATTEPMLAASLANVTLEPERSFRTSPSSVKWEQLVDAARYREAAAEYADASVAYRSERRSLVGFADMGIKAADARYAAGDNLNGDELLSASKSLIDSVFNFEVARHAVSQGSTFIAGVLEGALGLPSEPLDGFARTYAVGQAVGASLGLAGDAALVLKSSLLGASGAALAVGSNGALLPVGLAAAAEASAAMTAAVGAGSFHVDKLDEALNNLKMEDATKSVPRLRKVADGVWESKEGLRYADDAKYGNRVKHVLQHARDVPERDVTHGVFDVGGRGVIALVDEAWLIAKTSVSRVRVGKTGINTTYDVEMGRRIGYAGGRAGATAGHPGTSVIRIVVAEDGRLITAYPKFPK